MAFPTTVRGRYDARRKKYLRRAKRLWVQRPRGRVVPGKGRMHGAFAPRQVRVGNGTKQPRTPMRTRRSYTTHPLIPPLPPFITYRLIHHSPKPPYTQAFFFSFQLSTLKTHPKEAHVNFATRRVKYRGHKIGRLSGVTRKEHLALHIFLQTGFYPAWDPLHRVPVEP